MKNVKRVLSLLLCLMMVITAVPMGAVVDGVKALAAEVAADNTVDISAEKTEVDAFIKSLMDANDPYTVVSKHGTHFTWDNEKRENSKDNLYEWSYYNGVVFEGLLYLYQNTGEEKYLDYVVEYMETMIDENGQWVECSGCTGKNSGTYSGYYGGHGGDTIKTASLLLDLYEITKDSRYLTMANSINGDIDTAASKYSLKDAGSNLHHTWDTGASEPNLWLDGLYMVLPFRAEYAKYDENQTELDLIVSRLQWVSDYMYNSSKGLFYHAADNSTDNSGTYWLRSMGWYAAAIVDVMDSYDESSANFAKLQAQLTKLLDGLYKKASTSNGYMWLNNLAANHNASTNPYETSGSSLIYYAVMKAVNNGWISEDYADEAIACFKYICENKLANNVLTDICFKGAPGSGNTTFYDNEGKGVGPFIMFYAEMLEYVNKQEEETPEVSPSPEVTPTPTPDDGNDDTTETPSSENIEIKIDDETTVKATATGITTPVVTEVTAEDSALIEAKSYEEFLVCDIAAEITDESNKATLTFDVPEAWQAKADRIIGISVEDGEVKEIEGTYADGKFTFTVDHFSAKGIALAAANVETNGGDWELITEPTDGTTTYTYTLDTDGVNVGEKYLIVRDGYALNNNSGRVSVTTSNQSIKVSDDSAIAWIFSDDEDGYIYNRVNNSTKYINLRSGTLISGSSRDLEITDSGNGRYVIKYNGSTDYWLAYQSNSWQAIRSNSYVYLYRITDSTTTNGTNGEYAKIVDVRTDEHTDFVFNVPYNTSAADALAIVKDGITVYTNNTNSGTGSSIEDDNRYLDWELDTSYDETDIGGQYAVTIKYKEVLIGTAKVIVLDREFEVNELPTEGTVERDSADDVSTGETFTITYEDDENNPVTVDVTVGMLSGNFNIHKNGTYKNLTVTYNGVVITDKFTLNVVNKSGYNDFPTYPNEGSVDVDKIANGLDFQNTGLAKVELSTSGIPVQVGVDAVLVIDVSNSMSWATGTKTYNNNNKLDEVMTAVKDFAEIFLANNEDGTATNNTMSIVIFGGYDKSYSTESYADSTQTLVLRTNKISTVESIANGTYFTAENTIRIAYQNSNGSISNTSGSSRGDTNYDWAFQETNVVVDKILDANGDDSTREIHVLFMSDGCPTNIGGVYYRTDSATTMTYPVTGENYTTYSDWANANGITPELDATNGGKGAASDSGWMTAINKIIADNKGMPLARTVYQKVDGMYGVGFDMERGSFSGIGSWDEDVDWAKTFNNLISKLAGTDENGNGLITVTEASDTDTLNKFYSNLANELKYAATNAYFVDQMGTAFELQMAPVNKTVNGEPISTDITITTHPVYTKSQLGKEVVIGKDNNGNDIKHTVTADDIGKAYGDGTVLETVKFTSATAATSSALTDTNIINKDGVICAKYFYYNTTQAAVTIGDITIPPETFYWNIGTINETQFTLSYVVYLSNSMGENGGVAEGSYDTNNYATLYYENLHGNEVSQTVPSPSMPWGGANVSYAFYLVDDNGNPLASDGETITNIINAYKVTQPVVYDKINFNTTGAVLGTVVGNQVLPDGYELFDTSATYKVTPTSGGAGSNWVITKGTDKATTYVTGYAGLNEYSNVLAVEENSYDYTHTTVYFAVKWTIKAIPDTVVIDFGLPVDIDVLANDMFGGNGKLVGVGAKAENMTFTTGNYSSTYGDAEVKNGKVRYTPKNMEMNTYDRFAYSVNYTGSTPPATYYGEVTVIPATTVYYEDDFLTYQVSGSAEWVDVTDENKPAGIATQAEDRPGYYSLGQIDANNVYGYDKAYENMSQYSLGSAKMVHVSKVGTAINSGRATFTFYGTGFDVISLTSNTTGMITVNAYEYSKDENDNYTDTWDSTAEASYVVDTFYGMEKDGSLVDNKPEAIYQVPVMKVEGLDYGKYYVTITASYNSIFDHEQYEDASYDFYLDAIRIYDPANDGADSTVIKDAYVADKEGWPSYEELRNNIISAADFENNADAEFSGLIFIDSIDGTKSVADYVSYGPNNEVYLDNGQAVAFNVDTTDTNIADIQIALKVANGDSVTYTINGTEYTVKTATDLYRSILAEAKAGTVTIQNVSGGILSITNIKTTYAAEPVVQGRMLFMTRAAATEVLATLNAEDEIIEDTTTSTPETDDTTSKPEVSEPETSEPEVSEPEDDITSAPETSEPEEDETTSSKPEKEEKPGKDEKPDKDNKPNKEEKPNKNDKPEKDEKPNKDNQSQNDVMVKDIVKSIVKAVAKTVSKLLGKLFS